MKFASKIGIFAMIASLTGIAASSAFAQQPPREMKPLPRAEALKMAGERFDAADKNHDGQLSAEEARAGRSEGRPHEAQGQGQKGKQRPAPERQGAFEPISRADALKREAERFETSDKNGDGVLSVEEQRDAHPPRR